MSEVSAAADELGNSRRDQKGTGYFRRTSRTQQRRNRCIPMCRHARCMPHRVVRIEGDFTLSKARPPADDRVTGSCMSVARRNINNRSYQEKDCG